MATLTQNIVITYEIEFQRLCEVYHHIAMLEYEYPNFMDWYFNTVLPEIKHGLRKIYVAYSGTQIAGVMILKKSTEKKICTLRVSQNYRGQGLGHRFMELALDELEENLPLITVSDRHIKEYRSLFKDYHFSPSELHYNKYILGHAEIVFNGHLN